MYLIKKTIPVYPCLKRHILIHKYIMTMIIRNLNTYKRMPEAATEIIFENICSFLPGAPFSGFFQEALCVHQTDANFPGRFVCSLNRITQSLP